MQRAAVDGVGRHPRQLAALGIADGRLERHRDIADERRVAPVAQIEDAREPRPDGSIRNTRLFSGFTKGAVDRRLALVTGTARQRPGVAEVAPRNAVLQQDAALGVEGEQPGGPEPAPVALPRRRHDPRVARIPRTERAGAALRGRGARSSLAQPFTRPGCDPSDEQGGPRLLRFAEEGRHAAQLDALPQVGLGDAEQVHRHRASDDPCPALHRGVDELGHGVDQCCSITCLIITGPMPPMFI